MDTQVAAKTIRRKKAVAVAEQSNAALIQKIEARKDLRSRAERLAGDRICVLNWRFPEAANVFPTEPWMRTVSKYFRDASGGPLMVDEPELPHQVERCKRKLPILRELGKKHGFRYVVLWPDKTEADDIMELEQCG